MEKYCCDCSKLNRNDEYKDWYSNIKKYKCPINGYRTLDDIACDNIKEKSKDDGYKPSGADCYITTIVCEILGYEDNCELLNTLRSFRDTYLKKNLDKYLPILQQYDFIGPMISNSIRNMPDNKRFALMVMSYYLLPCSNEIKNNNFDEAIKIYKEMVLLLTRTFGISLTIGDNIPYNFEDLGKGRTRTNKNLK